MTELLQDGPATFSREQYRTLLQVAEAIAAHRDLGELFHDLAQRLPRTVPFDFINLVLHDPTRDMMRVHVLVVPEPGAIRPGMELGVDESPGGLVWKTQQPLMVEGRKGAGRKGDTGRKGDILLRGRKGDILEWH